MVYRGFWKQSNSATKAWEDEPESSVSPFSSIALKMMALTVRRNIDRVLTISHPSSSQTLPYKDRGLLLCEVHILRQLGQRVLPGVVRREFLEDLNDLVEVRTGVNGQLRIVERMRWAYAKWMQ